MTTKSIHIFLLVFSEFIFNLLFVVQDAIDFAENEHEKLTIKVDELHQSKTYCDKGIQTSKIHIKLPEVVQNSLPDQLPKVSYNKEIVKIDHGHHKTSVQNLTPLNNFLYGELHIILKPRNVKIYEHSIFQLLKNMFNRRLKIRFLLIIFRQ